MTKHRIVSAVLTLMDLPAIDGRRMLEEWRGGPMITRDIEREVYTITCSCGETGHAFEFSGIEPVFAHHLKLVSQ